MADEDDPRKLLSPKQVAEQMGFSERKVYRLIEHGHLPSFKIGHDRRIKQADIDEYLNRLAAS